MIRERSLFPLYTLVAHVFGTLKEKRENIHNYKHDFVNILYIQVRVCAHVFVGEIILIYRPIDCIILQRELS